MKKGFVTIPVSKLKKAKWNYKLPDQILKTKLMENIKTNGLIENLIVRELDNGSFEVINGNHRVDIAIELGIKEVMCYNLGKIPDALAKRIAIETNETKFTPDPSKLSELIQELTQTYSIDELVETMPYSASELEAFTKPLTDFNFEGIEEHTIEDVKVGKETELGKWKRSTTKCPNCGFEF